MNAATPETAKEMTLGVFSEFFSQRGPVPLCAVQDHIKQYEENALC